MLLLQSVVDASKVRELESKVKELEMKLHGGGDRSKLKELETRLLETRMLYTTTIDDYDIVSIIIITVKKFSLIQFLNIPFVAGSDS